MLDFYKKNDYSIIRKINKGGHIMTKAKTFKFSTLLVIALIAILVVGCKKRVTGIDASYSADVGIVEPDEVIKPDVDMDINDFAGNSYESGSHFIIKDGKPFGYYFYYTAKVEDGNIVIEQYNAGTGEKVHNPSLWPKKYSAVAADGQFTLTPQSKDNNIILNGKNNLVSGGTASFDETGLTIVFKEGGSTQTVRFEKQ